MGNSGYGVEECIKISGVADIQTRLRAFGDKINNVITQKALMESAKLVRAEARRIVRRDCTNDKDHYLKISGVYVLLHPGNLAKNIKIKRIKKLPKNVKGVQVYVFMKHAWYGKFVEGTELGTSIQQPHPFMRPAFESNKEAVMEIFKNYIASAIEGGRFRG